MRSSGRQRTGIAALGRLALLGVALLALSCGGTPTDELHVYSSVPLQGSGAKENKTIVDAIQMALSEHGGKAGRFRIKYISLDDSTKAKGKWDAGQETKNARRAAADPLAVAYIGTVNSGAAKVSIPILDRVQLAMVSPANTYPGLTKSSGALASEPYIYYPLGPDSQNFCRVLPSDDLQGAAGALYAQQKLGAKSVYVLDDTELYGHGIATIFAAKAKEIGLNVLAGPEGIETRTGAQFSQARNSEAQKVVAAKPDLVYFGGATENHPGELLNDLRKLGFRGVFMGPDGIDQSEFVDEASAGGVQAGQVFATLPGLPAEKLTGAGAAWYAKFKAQYGDTGQYTHYAYEAMNVVLDAIAKAGGVDAHTGKADRAAVLAAIRQAKNVQGILGAWSFDGHCDTTLTAISVNDLTNGKFQYKELAPQP
ncbi:MAG TPA: branched-chain amino acid ABC transporter substrate-binding protein [Dehalococcoidia bacterium]|nr:branched-chain amino acid ABC transporter substrate-binding protein [Dehalococcoidia bacterium]